MEIMRNNRRSIDPMTRNLTARKGFTMVYNSLIDTCQLTPYDKLVFITIKSFANNTTKQAFPSLATISRVSSISMSQVRKSVNVLQDCGILQKENRWLTYSDGRTSNLYTCRDSEDMFSEEFVNVEEEEKEFLREIPSELLIEELERRKKGIKKETTSQTDQDLKDVDSNNISICSNNSTSKIENQVYDEFNFDDVYNNIEYHADYDALDDDYDCDYGHVAEQPHTIQIQPQSQQHNPMQKQEMQTYSHHALYKHYHMDIVASQTNEANAESILNIIYDTINTSSSKIKIGNTFIPSETVKKRILDLNYEHITYVIQKYTQQSTIIHNPSSYIKRMLYDAKHNMDLEYTNMLQASHYIDDDFDKLE